MGQGPVDGVGRIVESALLDGRTPLVTQANDPAGVREGDVPNVAAIGEEQAQGAVEANVRVASWKVSGGGRAFVPPPDATTLRYGGP